MAAGTVMAQGNESQALSTSQGPDGGQSDARLSRPGPAANVATLAAENRRLQEDLRLAQGATAEFLDFVAHELKQPMTAILGYSRLLSMGIGGELTSTQRQFVDVIDGNVQRMARMVNDLLDSCRLEAGRIRLKLAPLCLEEILRETVADTRAELEARRHTVEIDISAHLSPVLGDRDRLLQILSHLVRNACRYTPDGGLIRLVAGGQQRDGDGGLVSVRVVDTGIGLSPEELARLGERFFRADHDLVQEQPGNGLGVFITRHLLALHGSELLVESKPGRGSTFTFSLPLAVEGQDLPD
jgi:signal transduction histidine kinase